jgi:hypothetical protein
MSPHYKKENVAPLASGGSVFDLEGTKPGAAAADNNTPPVVSGDHLTIDEEAPAVSPCELDHTFQREFGFCRGAKCQCATSDPPSSSKPESILAAKCARISNEGHGCKPNNGHAMMVVSGSLDKVVQALMVNPNGPPSPECKMSDQGSQVP